MANKRSSWHSHLQWQGIYHFSKEVIFSFYKSFICFLMWTILYKVFTEFITILFLLYVFIFWTQGIWDLSFTGRKPTTLALESEIPTTRMPGKTQERPNCFQPTVIDIKSFLLLAKILSFFLFFATSTLAVL